MKILNVLDPGWPNVGAGCEGGRHYRAVHRTWLVPTETRGPARTSGVHRAHTPHAMPRTGALYRPCEHGGRRDTPSLYSVTWRPAGSPGNR